MVTEVIGGLGLLIASLGLMVAVIANVMSNRNVIAAFNSMRAAHDNMTEAFQIHAGHCHALKDAEQLKLDLRCVVARIEQANGLESGDGMREHLIDRLGNSDAPRLKRWIELLSGERAHVDTPGLP